MKGFKTYIITKKTIIKFFVVFGVIIVILIILILCKAENSKYISVFSDNSVKIIDEGIVKEETNFNIKKIVTDILGFNPKKPNSIIEQSSVSFEDIAQTETPEPVPTPTAEEKKEKNTEELLPFDETETLTDLKINNNTEYDIQINELCKAPLDFSLDFQAPEVLLIHTHTTECYNGDAMSGEAERTTNENYNMCKIGDIIANKLESYGIKTIHDTTIHDYPSYQGAYSRAMNTIDTNINKYPSIKIVLDIHRDAYIYPDGSKLSVSTTINNEKISQVMLVLGTDSMGLSHPYWKSNLTFAAKIQNAANKMYPGLMRPINIRRERFNMHATKGSVLIEVGSNGNTLAESEKAAEYIANAIASVLING